MIELYDYIVSRADKCFAASGDNTLYTTCKTCYAREIIIRASRGNLLRSKNDDKCLRETNFPIARFIRCCVRNSFIVIYDTRTTANSLLRLRFYENTTNTVNAFM